MTSERLPNDTPPVLSSTGLHWTGLPWASLRWAKRFFASRPLRFRLGTQEFHKTGLTGFDPRDPYYFAVSISWSRFFLLFVAVEVAINLFFACLYMLDPGAIANMQMPRFVSAFFFSLETLATVGYGAMYPATLYGHIVSGFEILTGVIFLAIMTGLLFVRFSKPKARIQYAEHPVVARHNGKRTLMLRLGNARFNILHDAKVSLYTVVPTVSAEGREHFDIVELPLLRDLMPVFMLHWTIRHVLDATSPLDAMLRDPVSGRDARVFLTISARDPVIGQAVSDLHWFSAADIRHGMRYVDAVRRVSDNRVVADYALLGAIEPDTTVETSASEREAVEA